MDPVSALSVASSTLGVISIAVDAAETYRKGLSSIRGFRKTDASVEQILRQLQFQQAILQNTISELYREAGVTTTSGFSLVGPDTAPPEAQEEADSRLREYLGQDYELVIGTLQEIDRDLQVAVESFRHTADSLESKSFTGASEAQLLKKAKWSLGRRKKTEKLLNSVSVRNNHLEDLLRNVIVSKGRIADISSTAQAFAEAVESYNPDDDDGASIETMSISDEDENKLSYLAISLWGKTGILERPARRQIEACLDSAATRYCISEMLSQSMDLRTEKIERQEVTTANDQKFFYYSRVKLYFSWREENKASKEKWWFCVVPNLFESIVLPNDFINRRKNILSLATRRRAGKIFIASMGFPWRDKGKIEEDQRKADAARKKTQDKDAALAKQRQLDLEQKYGIPPDPNSPSPGSSQAPNVPGRP